jgi:putative phosphoesterase
MSSTHRIALISDLHGNAIALRTVLRAIEADGVDEIICLGDVATLGVGPGDVVDILQALGCRCINGNHDDYVLRDTPDDGHNDTPILRESIQWAREQLSKSQLEFVNRFEAGIDLELGAHRIMLFHGSPSSNLVNLLAETPPEEFDALLGPERAMVMAGGHTHLPMLRQHRGVLVVNPGSVGAAFREYPFAGPPVIMPVGQYASIEVRDERLSVQLHQVPLDRSALLKAARDSSNPLAPALMAVGRS